MITILYIFAICIMLIGASKAFKGDINGLILFSFGMITIGIFTGIE